MSRSRPERGRILCGLGLPGHDVVTEGQASGRHPLDGDKDVLDRARLQEETGGTAAASSRDVGRHVPR